MHPNVGRVAGAFLKKSLYWAQKDRQYKMTRGEQDTGKPCCPSRGCAGRGQPLKKAIYKRRGGASEGVLACPECMFIVKATDILNHPTSVLDEAGA